MRNKKILSLLSVMLICLLLAGCGATLKADISSYENDKITVGGLGDGEFTVTAAELAQLDCVSKTVDGQSKKGDVRVKVYGPSLETFLADKGIDMSQISDVTFIGKDGYAMQFNQDFFVTHPDIYLSIASDNDPLSDEEEPVHIVIPGATTDNWVKGVKEIQFK